MTSHALAVQGSWLDMASSWSGIVGTILALLVVALGIWVSSSAYQAYALLKRRRKYIGPIVRRTGLCRSRYRFVCTCYYLLSLRVRSGRFQVSDELAWLSALNQARAPEKGLSPAHPVPLPFTFALPGAEYSRALRALADAYTEYASAVRRRWLLRSAAGPLTAQEHECATATARILSRWASFEPVEAAGTASRLRGMRIELRRGGALASTRLVAWPYMTAPRVTPGFPVVGVSYQPYRVVMEASPVAEMGGGQREIRLIPRAAGTPAPSPLFYDGVLPRWHGPGCRVEIDRITGRQKLHLCISETTYFAFRATQDPRTVARAGAAALCARLLSLNLLALDEDDVVLLIQRSDRVVYPRQYTGTATGNCELTAREGLSADLDQHGLPDLLGAIAREAREELGIDFADEAGQLTALGVIEYSGETELETHALVATARLRMRARDFRIERSAPDPGEGLWEMGDHVMAIDLRAIVRDRSAGERFVGWVRTSEQLSPAGAGSLLLLVAARLELRERQADSSASRSAGARRNGWTSADLERWLSAPVPGRPVRPGKHVSFQPLWS